jgi:hypothetical protein
MVRDIDLNAKVGWDLRGIRGALEILDYNIRGFLSGFLLTIF